MSKNDHATAEEAIIGAMLEVGYPADTACSMLDQVKATAQAEGSAQTAHTPLTLGTLEAACNAAEIPTGDNPPRKGDTIIEFDSSPCYRVTVVGCDWGGLTRYDSAFVRILSRAPKREPWEDLADVLADMGHLSPTGHAKALHELGVRVTGGEES